jgi:hypothetical protein
VELILSPVSPVIHFEPCGSVFEDIEIVFSTDSEIDGASSMGILQIFDVIGLCLAELKSISQNICPRSAESGFVLCFISLQALTHSDLFGVVACQSSDEASPSKVGKWNAVCFSAVIDGDSGPFRLWGVCFPVECS